MKMNRPNSRHLQIIDPFRFPRAIILSLVSGVITTGVLFLGNIYSVDRLIDPRFHIVMLLVSQTLLFFVLYLFNFDVFRNDQMRVHNRYILAGAGSLIIALSYSLVERWFQTFHYGIEFNDAYLALDLLKGGMMGVTSYLITSFLFNNTRQHRMLIENERLNAENIEIQYDSLVKQIDPHFLFNSLNTLDGLIGVYDEKAHCYLNQLASSYRYITQTKKSVTLSEELNFANAYIYMMKIRYGDCLSVEINIDDECLDWLVVPISLQLLIENAVKHNVVSDRHPLLISIESTDHATLRISNPLHPKDGDTESEGVGLSNLDQRCQLVFHESIAIQRTDTHFIVEIPLSKTL